jgi:hypothetical protein
MLAQPQAMRSLRQQAGAARALPLKAGIRHRGAPAFAPPFAALASSARSIAAAAAASPAALTATAAMAPVFFAAPLPQV